MRTLQDIFNAFTGKDVNVTEKTEKLTFKNTGTYEFTDCRLDQNDPTISALQKAFDEFGVKAYRIMLPGTMATMDFNPSRVNVNIAKNDKGSYVISSFGMG